MGLIPPFFVDSVVAIGLEAPDGKKQWVASAFMYGYRHDEDASGINYRVYLVTNRHVFERLKAGKALVRYNARPGEAAREFVLGVEQNGKPLWFLHPDPDVDIAVTPVAIGMLKANNVNVSYYRSDVHAAPRRKMAELGMTEGDFVYVLGFPMGLVGDFRNAVVVRHGCIARIRDVTEGAAKSFLIDAAVYPGNSGGPVVSKPEVIAIEGTTAQTTAYLIGVVRSYVPYLDVATSQQTGRARISFEENSDLAEVHTVEQIEEALMPHVREIERSIKPPPPEPPLPSTGPVVGSIETGSQKN